MSTPTKTPKQDPAESNGAATPATVSAAPMSVRFTEKVQKQFEAEAGAGVEWTPLQRTLAQHLYIKIDASLKALDTKRGRDAVPITWENVNMTKLALDAVHRVSLGLDALIPNHIHVVPYINGRTQKYDLDLRVGYTGMDHVRRTLALDPPKDIIYHLVHENDEFEPYWRGLRNEVESYKFLTPKPFDRGSVVGGFGYIVYDDPSKNRLIVITQRDFQKAESAAMTKDFWSEAKWRQEMQFKTVVHRVTSKIPLDPAKINGSAYAALEEAERDVIEAEFAEEVAANANRETLALSADSDTGEIPVPATDRAEPSPVEAKAAEKPAEPVKQENPY